MARTRQKVYQVVSTQALDAWIERAQRARPGVSASRLIHDALLDAANPFDQLRGIVAAPNQSAYLDESDVPIFVPKFGPPKKLHVKTEIGTEQEAERLRQASEALRKLRQSKK